MSNHIVEPRRTTSNHIVEPRRTTSNHIVEPRRTMSSNHFEPHKPVDSLSKSSPSSSVFYPASEESRRSLCLSRRVIEIGDTHFPQCFFTHSHTHHLCRRLLSAVCCLLSLLVSAYSSRVSSIASVSLVLNDYIQPRPYFVSSSNTACSPARTNSLFIVSSTTQILTGEKTRFQLPFWVAQGTTTMASMDAGGRGEGVGVASPGRWDDIPGTDDME